MFRIAELLAEVIARVEPGVQSRCGSLRRFVEQEAGMAGRPQPVIGNCHYGVDNMPLIFGEDLDDVPVGRRIEQLEYIGDSRQYSVLNLYRLVRSKVSFLVPHISLR